MSTLLSRRFSLAILAGVAACVLECTCFGAGGRPNIVFIIADDLGWNDIGYHGSEIATPHLDRLARDGRRFDRHYVCPTCTPTRVGFTTGRYPSRYGVLSPAYGQIFDERTLTIASALRARGYDTAMSGKWHMGGPPLSVPLACGYNRSYGYLDGQIDPYTHRYKTGRRSWHRNDEFLDEEGHATDLITNEAVLCIESKLRSPFFLYVAYSVPHFPLNEPETWLAPYEQKIKDPMRRLFAASVTHMDQGIGRIVDALNRTGKRKETIVIFVSDNGGQKSWHSKTQYGGRYADKPHTVLGDNRPLRGWKGQLYEGGIRVPALVNWPGVITKGTITAPAHIVDWMPTLCGLAGYTPPWDPAWDGQTIWPSITGQAQQPRTFYWKTPGATAVRRGDWKLITGGKKRTELYNVTADPYEKEDRSGTETDRTGELRALLARIAKADRPRKN